MVQGSIIFQNCIKIDENIIKNKLMVQNFFNENIKKKRFNGSKENSLQTLEGGLEPPTLWLTATRSNQLSYSSLLLSYCNKYLF